MALPTKPAQGGRNYVHPFPSCAIISLHLKTTEKNKGGSVSIWRKDQGRVVLENPADLDFVVLDEVNKISSNTSNSSYFRSTNPGMEIRFWPEKGDTVKGTYRELMGDGKEKKKNPIVEQAKGKFKTIVFGILDGKELAQMEIGGMLFSNSRDTNLPKGWIEISKTQTPENSRLILSENFHKAQLKNPESGIMETYYLPIWEFVAEDVISYLSDPGNEHRMQLAALLDAALSERLGEAMNPLLAPVKVDVTTPTTEESPVFEDATFEVNASGEKEDLPF